MPTLQKIARPVKRARVLVKKRALKPRIIKKKQRNPIYEKLKSNNIALARALSKEKQESQYLYSQNIKLTGQVQDMQGSLNKREEIISGILRNSSEALKLLVQATNCVTSTILSCQQVVGSQPFNSTNQLKSTTNSTMSRRESVRRSSGKSPARGVVQPMVSGHTITKPVINLSRINMQRLAASPNMSDIEESVEVSTPNNSEPLTSTRVVGRQRRSLSRHIGNIIMPQRIRRSTSSRVSDEDEQISPPPPPPLSSPTSSLSSPSSLSSSPRRLRPASTIQSRRITDRKRKSSNVTNQQQSTETHDVINDSSVDLSKSPRVSLQDVSVLMQNSQTVNVKKLLKNGSTSASGINEAMNNIQAITESKSDQDQSFDESPTYGFDTRFKKRKKKRTSDEADPLEGPSWLLNDSDIVSSPEQNTSTSDLTGVILQSQTHQTNLPVIPSRKSNNLSNGTSKLIGNQQNNSINNDYYNNDDEDSDNDDDYDDNNEVTENIQPLPLSRFAMVTKERSHATYDDDDFTMIINRPPPPPSTQNASFNIDELELPEVERPFADPNAVVDIEPEITKTIRLIGHHNLRQSALRTTNIFKNSMSPQNMSMMAVPVPEPIADDSSDDDYSAVIPLNQSNSHSGTRNFIDSSSESDESPSPKKTCKQKTIKGKDPSSAKVVLEKLSNVKTSKRLSSPDPRRSSYDLSRNMSMASLDPIDLGSDSDSSNASINSKTLSRPRRQKAPVNLKEPNIRRKLRR